MSNAYEPLRNDVIKLISDTCITETPDKSRTAFAWNIGKVFSNAEKQFGNLLLNGKLPETLKDMIRFEFNKLKDTTMSDKNWTAIRSTKSFVLRPDGIERRRQDLYGLKAISLQEQLTGARTLLDKVGKSLANSKNEETTLRMKKRQNRLLKEIMFIEDAMKNIASLTNPQTEQEKQSIGEAVLA